MFEFSRRISLIGTFLGILLACESKADDKKPTAEKKIDEKKIEINIGDKAPTFDLRTDSDTTWSSSERYGKKWVVVYFYPATSLPVAPPRREHSAMP